jgi:hypothetical protein
LLEQAAGKPDDWYLTTFSDLGEELLEAKDSMIDPIQSFLNGSQRTIYDDAVALLAANGNNLGYLPTDSDTDVKRMLDDPNAFRGNRMTQLKLAAESLGKQVEEALATNRAFVIDAIEGRRTEVLGSAYYQNATGDAQARVIGTIDQIMARVERERQIALIREAGNNFEETTYPSLLDQLASSQRPILDPDGPAPPPARHTVSIKTITAPGLHGRVLENADDVDRYLDALGAALLSTLNEGKRIAL